MQLSEFVANSFASPSKSQTRKRGEGEKDSKWANIQSSGCLNGTFGVEVKKGLGELLSRQATYFRVLIP
jgi:hypothetical protein